MSGYDEAVLIDAGDSSELFDGGRGEAVAKEARDKWGVFVPEPETVSKDLHDGEGVEVFVFLWEGVGGRAVGLVEVLRLRGWAGVGVGVGGG